MSWHPIALTVEGDLLIKYPKTEQTDATLLSTCVGLHGICGGWMDIKDTSGAYRALVCRQCHLRVVVPRAVVILGDRVVVPRAMATLGDLRRWFGSSIKQPEAMPLPKMGDVVKARVAHFPFTAGDLGVVIERNVEAMYVRVDFPSARGSYRDGYVLSAPVLGPFGLCESFPAERQRWAEAKALLKRQKSLEKSGYFHSSQVVDLKKEVEVFLDPGETLESVASCEESGWERLAVLAGESMERAKAS